MQASRSGRWKKVAGRIAGREVAPTLPLCRFHGRRKPFLRSGQGVIIGSCACPAECHGKLRVPMGRLPGAPLRSEPGKPLNRWAGGPSSCDRWSAALPTGGVVALPRRTFLMPGPPIPEKGSHHQTERSYSAGKDQREAGDGQCPARPACCCRSLSRAQPEKRQDDHWRGCRKGGDDARLRSLQCEKEQCHPQKEADHRSDRREDQRGARRIDRSRRGEGGCRQNPIASPDAPTRTSDAT